MFAQMSCRSLGENLLRTVLGFCEILRQYGLAVLPSQEEYAIRSLCLVGVLNKERLRLILAINFGIRPEDLPLFNRLFDAYWTASPQAGEILPETPEAGGLPAAPVNEGEAILSSGGPEVVSGEASPDGASFTGRPQRYRTGYSPEERLSSVDLASLAEEGDRETLRRLVSLAVRLPVLPRRWASRTYKRGELDVRRMLRRSLSVGGELVAPVWRKRVKGKSRLVLLCDISGSMEAYSRIFLCFLHTLQKNRRQVETFVFGTRLSRATRALLVGDYYAALTKLSLVAQDWGGGTDIGRSLGEFNAGPGRWLLHKRTGVVILSDGWDRGDPDRLRREMGRLSSKAAWVFWLNPLLGNPHYEPLSLGIRTVRPFVRQMLPANSLKTLLASLRNVYRHLYRLDA